MPDDVMPDMNRFKEASIQNGDGFGFAILEKNRFVKAHSMNFNEIANKFVDARDKHKGPAIFHFRWATHGSETVDNCHPFLLGDDPTSIMGHNGILPVKIPKDDKRSDTKVFAEDIMPAIGGITSLDDTKYFDKMEKWAGGNKLVFLTHNDDAKYAWYILNSHLGHWDKEMWWSNKSYEPYATYKSPSSKSYASGWGYDSYGYDAFVNNDDYKWDYTAKRYTNVNDSKPLEYVYTDYDYDDEAELWQEDIEELAMQKFRVYMSYIDNETSLVECYSCTESWKAQEDDWPTECKHCAACLHCGHYGGCNCWLGLDDFFYEANIALPKSINGKPKELTK